MEKFVDPDFMTEKEFNGLRNYVVSLFDTPNIKENFTISKTTFDTAKTRNWILEITLRNKVRKWSSPNYRKKADPYDKLRALQTIMNNILEMEKKDYILTDVRTTKGFSITVTFRPAKIVAKEYLLNE